MGKIHTPESLRWERAKIIAENGAITQVKQNGPFWRACVQGSANRPYAAFVLMRDGKLGGCRCNCPDYTKMKARYKWCLEHLDHDELAHALRGIPLVRGIVVCKHALALAHKVTQ